MSISPIHGAVLGAAAVVASPALWLAVVDQTLPLSEALTRYLLSVVACWAALNVVAQLAFPSQESVRARVRESESETGSQAGSEAGYGAVGEAVGGSVGGAVGGAVGVDAA